MTIKEIEQTTGLPRASVRFYESEGFLSPTRGENGYRSYSQSDLDTLLKIKLLRRLDIPLEDIKALQKDQCSLDSVLSAALTRLEQDSARLEQALELCRTLRREQNSYSALNPRPYLQRLDIPGSVEAEKFTYDRLPNATCPFRRFFARDLDMTIWSAVFLLFCQLVLRVNILSGHPALQIFRWFIPTTLVVLSEPLMLHFFCTTPGKFLFGLKITRGDGSPLSPKEAFTRTFSLTIFGAGLYIPVISPIVMAIAWRRLRQGDTLSWDYAQDVAYWDSTRPGREHYWDYPKHVGKAAIAIVLYLCLILLPGLSHRTSARTVHQGDLTVAQFVENFNDFQRFKLENGDSLRYVLTEEGTFSETPPPMGEFIYDITESEPIPFTFHTENDILTAITFEHHSTGEQIAAIPYGRMSAALWALLYGREGIGQKELSRIHDEIGRGEYRLLPSGEPGSASTLSFSYELPGAAVEFELTCSGYLGFLSDMLFAQEGSAPEYTMSFALTLTD